MSLTFFYETKRNIYRGLTRFNYFPNQRSGVSEIPPCITSRHFTPEICEAIAGLAETKPRRSKGYDVVEYKATRYNNVPRILSLIHPKAYALLAKHLHDNWDEFGFVSEGDHSIVKPRPHEDGRIIVMNYEDPFAKNSRINQISFGKKVLVQTDIANCFNSIYSHAVEWALIGFEEAKKRNKGTFSSDLDLYLRKTKRNETQGIAIGPASSSIVAELILSKIDDALIEKNFCFNRYVDDYTCYCETTEEADDFLLELGQQLAAYKLTLNIEKTKIIELPASTQDSWIIDLLGALPSRLSMGSTDEPKLTAAEVLTFINRAIDLVKTTPDGSVLKYALSIIIGQYDDRANIQVFELIMNLSWHYPILIPYLASFNPDDIEQVSDFEEKLSSIIIKNAKLKRSDGMAWPLHIFREHKITPSQDVVQAVIESKDCVSMVILNTLLEDQAIIVDFAKELLSQSLYEKDSYWLLLYQLYREKKIDNPYKEDQSEKKVFEILRDNQVNFIPQDNKETEAEAKCDEISIAPMVESFLGTEKEGDSQQSGVE
ncbi:antiviral reverse transcriptase Drt4 [Leucothrix pacifica]|uniref:Reverse transcriptase domain-containing protein n=1 Tax=Leucothrix pacifica TaxID=1247513 RepID=A0A317CDX4_9GAMM|nr:antiviral reverse transcriptase Drt4 [Leucothrix pacifica]PWQ96736.1 hypothetical protein DKW60_12055 [Leucothrix pacifica]